MESSNVRERETGRMGKGNVWEGDGGGRNGEK